MKIVLKILIAEPFVDFIKGPGLIIRAEFTEKLAYNPLISR